MIKTLPEKLVMDLLPRAQTNVQVAAVIEDKKGIFAWGWSSIGPNGRGLCAERMAISRANRRRLKGSTLYVGGRWRRSGNLVMAFPCALCLAAARKVGVKRFIYTTKDGSWRVYELNG